MVQACTVEYFRTFFQFSEDTEKGKYGAVAIKVALCATIIFPLIACIVLLIDNVRGRGTDDTDDAGDTGDSNLELENTKVTPKVTNESNVPLENSAKDNSYELEDIDRLVWGLSAKDWEECDFNKAEQRCRLANLVGDILDELEESKSSNAEKATQLIALKQALLNKVRSQLEGQYAEEMREEIASALYYICQSQINVQDFKGSIETFSEIEALCGDAHRVERCISLMEDCLAMTKWEELSNPSDVRKFAKQVLNAAEQALNMPDGNTLESIAQLQTAVTELRAYLVQEIESEEIGSEEIDEEEKEAVKDNWELGDFDISARDQRRVAERKIKDVCKSIENTDTTDNQVGQVASLRNMRAFLEQEDLPEADFKKERFFVRGFTYILHSQIRLLDFEGAGQTFEKLIQLSAEWSLQNRCIVVRNSIKCLNREFGSLDWEKINGEMCTSAMCADLITKFFQSATDLLKVSDSSNIQSEEKNTLQTEYMKLQNFYDGVVSDDEED